MEMGLSIISSICGLQPPTSNAFNRNSYSVQNLIWIEFESSAPKSISHNSIVIFKWKKLRHPALVKMINSDKKECPLPYRDFKFGHISFKAEG